MNRLKDRYQQEVIPQLKQELGLTNNMAVPRVSKIVVNIGITDDQHRDQALDNVAEQLAIITGQIPKRTVARKSISGFKLRQGDRVGLAVTLRGERMYQFLDKLISIVLPRVKDFQGTKPGAFDQSGNYSLGLEEQIVFPEIEYDKIDRVRSLQVNIVTTANEPESAMLLLRKLGFPFAKNNSENQ